MSSLHAIGVSWEASVTMPSNAYDFWQTPISPSKSNAGYSGLEELLSSVQHSHGCLGLSVVHTFQLDPDADLREHLHEATVPTLSAVFMFLHQLAYNVTITMCERVSWLYTKSADSDETRAEVQ